MIDQSPDENVAIELEKIMISKFHEEEALNDDL